MHQGKVLLYLKAKYLKVALHLKALHLKTTYLEMVPYLVATARASRGLAESIGKQSWCKTRGLTWIQLIRRQTSKSHLCTVRTKWSARPAGLYAVADRLTATRSACSPMG